MTVATLLVIGRISAVCFGPVTTVFGGVTEGVGGTDCIAATFVDARTIHAGTTGCGKETERVLIPTDGSSWLDVLSTADGSEGVIVVSVVRTELAGRELCEDSAVSDSDFRGKE